MSSPPPGTPLGKFFYEAYLRAGLTYKQIAEATRMPVPTVAAYINGTRGLGAQQRTIGKIRAIARALNVDEEEALRLARLTPDEGVIRAILDDPRLPPAVRDAALRAWKEELRRAQEGS